MNNYDLLIQKLDRFTRKFYVNQLLRGLLCFVGLILLLFIAFNLLEHQFYFSQGGRKLLFFSFIAISAGSAIYWILMPAMKYFQLGKTISHEQAAVIVGEHFTDVKDRLLNILQLKKQSQSGGSTAALIQASINQKSASIRPVNFPKAIDLRKNKKYLRYAFPPFLLLLAILLGAPSIITDSTHRIINNSTDFEKAAPFHFRIQQGDLSILQFGDFTLDVDIDGDVLPEEVFIDVDNYQYRLNKVDNNSFQYTFKNVQKSQNFNLFSGSVKSDDKTLEMLPKPNLLDFALNIDYPAYTGRTDERIENIGDLVVPAGTRIAWTFQTSNAKNVDYMFSNKDERTSAEQKGENQFAFNKRIFRDDIYTLYVANEHMPLGDSVSYSINAIPDQHPVINVETFQDSTETAVSYFVGNAADDYGLSSLSFNYQIIDDRGVQRELVSTPIDLTGGKETQYDYLFDATELGLEPGFKVNYYFEVYDNDGVNGRKSAKTGIMSFEKASIEELKELEDENEEDIKNNLEESIEEAKKIQDELKKMREKLLQEKELGWQDKKELEELMEKQAELQKRMEETKQKFDENLENQKQMSQQDEEILQKQEQLQKMFEEVLDEETQKLMEQIQELMEELNKETTLDMMEEMEMSDEQMEKEMDRLLELYKQLELEKEMKETIEELEELAEEQEKLSEETKNEEKSNEELKKDQEEINEKFEDIKEKMEELEEKNEELEFPKEMGEDNEEKMEDIEEDLDDSQEQLEKQENQSASESQKKASKKMKGMAGSLQSSMQQGEEEQMEEDIQALRQLLENIVTLSFDQEGLVNHFQKTNVNTPRYVGLVQEQFKIQDDFQLVEDSLQALSMRVAQIETFVTEKVTEVKYNLKESIENLEERQIPVASQNQRFTMKNLNDLALMLAESMEQMQQQMAGMMSGNQMCDNPGKGKDGKKGKSGSSPMDKITKGQEGLSDQLKEMMEKMKDGKGEGGGGSAKDFAQAAARQAAMRKALEELQQQREEEGSGMSKELQEIIDEMDKNEIDLVNKRLDAELLKRQEDIKTKLLEADKADRQREYENKRKGETAQEVKRKIPPSIEEYIKKREAEIDMYKSISPSLKPYYRNLVQQYYDALKTK